MYVNRIIYILMPGHFEACLLHFVGVLYSIDRNRSIRFLIYTWALRGIVDYMTLSANSSIGSKRSHKLTSPLIKQENISSC